MFFLLHLTSWYICCSVVLTRAVKFEFSVRPRNAEAENGNSWLPKVKNNNTSGKAPFRGKAGTSSRLKDSWSSWRVALHSQAKKWTRKKVSIMLKVTLNFLKSNNKEILCKSTGNCNLDSRKPPHFVWTISFPLFLVLLKLCSVDTRPGAAQAAFYGRWPVHAQKNDISLITAEQHLQTLFWCSWRLLSPLNGRLASHIQAGTDLCSHSSRQIKQHKSDVRAPVSRGVTRVWTGCRVYQCRCFTLCWLHCFQVVIIVYVPVIQSSSSFNSRVEAWSPFLVEQCSEDFQRQKQNVNPQFLSRKKKLQLLSN